MCGDFNSHVGTKSDILEFDQQILHEFGMSTENVECNLNRDIPGNFQYNRMSVDTSLDQLYGDRLLMLCRESDMLIFNGRCGLDSNYGSATTAFNSVVDYVIGSPFIMGKTTMFNIRPFCPMLSDIHCVIAFDIDCSLNALIIIVTINTN